MVIGRASHVNIPVRKSMLTAWHFRKGWLCEMSGPAERLAYPSQLTCHSWTARFVIILGASLKDIFTAKEISGPVKSV